MIGRTLGGYRIVEQIGMGGMATVYKAYEASTDRYVALKTLPQQYSKDPQFVERFRREALAIAKLEHIHILPLFAYGEDDGIAYLVMRYLPAGTLGDRIRQMGQMPLEEAARILGQVASALDHAHANSILHRDIKPSNILVDKEGNVYLTDFGIARIVEGTLDLTGDALLGTPQYMSPEQCQGRKDLTPATDQYSLGVVLYEMVTGRTPFQAETPLALIHMQMMGAELPPPTALRPELPDAVEKVILKALDREPNNRFPSCLAMSKAFEDAIKQPAPTRKSVRSKTGEAETLKASVPSPVSDSPTTRLPVDTTPVLKPAQASSRLIIGAVAGLAVIVIVALLFANRSTPPPAAGTETPGAEIANAPTDPASNTTPDQNADLVAQGDGYMSNYDYDKALAAYNQALQAAPDNTDILMNRAAAYRGQGDYPSAISDYMQVSKLDPKREDAYTQLGDAYQSLGQYDDAIASYSKAADLGSTDPHVYGERGKLYSARGDGNNAIADLNKSIQLDPNYSFTYVDRGNEYLRQENRDAALADFTKAIRLDANNVWAYRGRANLYRAQGDLQSALDDLNAAMPLTPDDATLVTLRGQVWSQYGNNDAALDDFNKAIELAPDYPDAYIVRAQEHYYRDELDLALADFNKAIEFQPDNADLYAGRGLVYRGKGEYADALVDYGDALRLQPDNAQFYADRATVHEWNGDLDGAIKDLDQAIKLQPDFVSAYVQRAGNYTYSGDYDKALADYAQVRKLDASSMSAYIGPVENLISARNSGGTVTGYTLDMALKDADHAVSLNPRDDAGLYFNRAQIHIFRNEHKEAVADLTSAINLISDYAPAYVMRAQQYVALVDPSHAIADLQQAIKLDPNLADAYQGLGDLYFAAGQPSQALDAYRHYADLVGSDSITDQIRQRMSALEAAATATP